MASPRDFYSSLYVAYPLDLKARLSGTSKAKEVFTGYKFSENLQKFMLDYSMKTMGNIPLSDEVKSHEPRLY